MSLRTRHQFQHTFEKKTLTPTVLLIAFAVPYYSFAIPSPYLLHPAFQEVGDSLSTAEWNDLMAVDSQPVPDGWEDETNQFPLSVVDPTQLETLPAELPSPPPRPTMSSLDARIAELQCFGCTNLKKSNTGCPLLVANVFLRSRPLLIIQHVSPKLINL